MARVLLLGYLDPVERDIEVGCCMDCPACDHGGWCNLKPAGHAGASRDGTPPPDDCPLRTAPVRVMYAKHQEDQADVCSG